MFGGNEAGPAHDEFVEVVKKNKGKQPVWQPKRTKIGPVILEPGPSHQVGCNNGLRQTGLKDGNGKLKPSDKAAGLQRSSDVGGGSSGLQKHGPTEVPRMKQSLGSKMAAGLQGNASSDVGSGDTLGLILSDVHFPPLTDGGPVPKGPIKGSGFFDISKQAFGSGPSPNVSTKNSFGTLRDEEECFDTDLGLWENEIEVVKKFVDSNIRPKIEDYESWSASMKKYYDSLTKMNEDDEVASETDEMARFMKSGVKS
ncbi:hypothetical protein Hanom_Chr05g00428621 [Helianthus anomalus]